MPKAFTRNMGSKVKIIREDGSTALINPKIVDHEAVKQLNIRLAPEEVPVPTKRFAAVPPVELLPAEGDDDEIQEIGLKLTPEADMLVPPATPIRIDVGEVKQKGKPGRKPKAK